MAAIEQTETSIPRTDTFSDDLNGTIPGDGNLKAGAEDASIIKVSSCPPSPVPEKTREQIIASRIQFAALCLSLFLLGWNDGSTGPLIPRLREVYNVRIISSFHDIERFNFAFRSVLRLSLLFSLRRPP